MKFWSLVQKIWEGFKQQTNKQQTTDYTIRSTSWSQTKTFCQGRKNIYCEKINRWPYLKLTQVFSFLHLQWSSFSLMIWTFCFTWKVFLPFFFCSFGGLMTLYFRLACRNKQVAQGQYVVSDIRCPALNVCQCMWWLEKREQGIKWQMWTKWAISQRCLKKKELQIKRQMWTK